MLNYTKIKTFFKNCPEGFIELVQMDGNNFRLYKDTPYSLDETSITFMNIIYTTKKYGNEYVKKGNFVLPFNHIIRVEYIKIEKE